MEFVKMNNTLANGFRILEVLSDGKVYTVKELSEKFQLPPSHICRLLKTLLETGYIEQPAGTRKYRVSLKILTLANAWMRHSALRIVGRPHLQRLSRDLNCQAYLSEFWHGHSIVIDVTYPEGGMADPSMTVGQVHRIAASACGRICAAYAGPADLEVLVEELRADGTPEETVSAFLEDLPDIRKTGLSVRPEADLLAVAAPILRNGETFCGALGIFFPGLTRKDLTPAIINALKTSAKAISTTLLPT